MSDNEKYYYLRLKEDFFEDDAIQILESMQDGYLYSNVLLKLYLKSLKFNGKLMFNDRIPYNPTVLATITRHHVGTVEKALSIFRDLGLIEILDNGAMYMLDIQNFIGKTSTEADRKRAYRERIDQEKQELIEQNSGQMSGQISDKKAPEIKIEIEKDIYKKHTVQEACTLFEKLWKLYPSKKGKGQVSDSKKKALLKIGEEELIKAIERYKLELEKDKDWRKVQNGSTFFNSGYIDYLDANYAPGDVTKPKTGNNKFNNFTQRDYSANDFESMEQKLLNRR